MPAQKEKTLTELKMELMVDKPEDRGYDNDRELTEEEKEAMSRFAANDRAMVIHFLKNSSLRMKELGE